MEALRLALRGLRWRAGSSLAVLLVSVVSMAGAALGPLYAHSASESLVRGGLVAAPPVSTGVQTSGSIAGQTEYPPLLLEKAVAARAAEPGLDRWYGPPTLSLTVHNGAPRVAGRLLGDAQVSWYQGQCGGVTVVSGRCPSAPSESMVSARMLSDGLLKLGDTMQLGVTSDPKLDRTTIVGSYDPTTYDPKVWGLGNPDQFAPAHVPDAPPRLDEVIVDEQTLLRSNGDLSAVSLRRLDAATVHLSDLPALRDAVSTATAIPATIDSQVPTTTSISGLLDYLDSLQPQLDGVASASFAVTAQLVLLAWFVLFLVIAATSEERSGEIALAKLRGMTPRATLAFGLAEPVLLLVLALPVGLLLAYVADLVLTRRFLADGTEVALSWAVFLALTVCLLGGAAAAGLAARGILTAPVLEQLRRTGGRRAKLVRSAAIDAAAVALAAAGIYELKRGGSDSLALVAPGLIALAAGLLAVRALPWVARIEVSRTRRSSAVASFLSSRNIARRPSGLRIVVLLSLAVGLAVFAVDGWVVSAANRSDQARAEVGAAQVWHVQASSAGALLSAVNGVDASGSQVMAAVEVANGSGGLLAVDARRLAAVTSWDPTWAGMAPADLGPTLHPPSGRGSLLVHGRITLTVDWARTGGDAPALLGVAVRAASGVPTTVTLGALRPGTSTYRAELPPCVDLPCTLVALTFTHPIAVPSSQVEGTVSVTSAADSVGAVDLASLGTAGWRSGASSISPPIDPGAKIAAVADGRLAVDVVVSDVSDAAVEVADHPVTLPVLQGSNISATNGTPSDFPVVEGLDGRFVPKSVNGTGVLPQLLRSGTLADLPYSLAAMSLAPNPLDYQVWLSPGAPSSIRQDLAQAGITVVSVQTIEDRNAELDRSGSALALRLFLLAALVSLVLGAGTLLANAYVVIRRRAYELAALRALGAPRDVLVRAARREQVLLALAGVLLGAASGLGAAGVALPPLIAASGDAGPPPWYGPAWVPVVVLLVLVLGLLAVVADLGARRTVRRALPELLRQVQE